jgi:hypothetical protein
MGKILLISSTHGLLVGDDQGDAQRTLKQFRVTANKMQRFLIYLFISKNAVQVSGGSSAHYQEHTTVQTASGIVKQYCC